MKIKILLGILILSITISCSKEDTVLDNFNYKTTSANSWEWVGELHNATLNSFINDYNDGENLDSITYYIDAYIAEIDSSINFSDLLENVSGFEEYFQGHLDINYVVELSEWQDSLDTYYNESVITTDEYYYIDSALNCLLVPVYSDQDVDDNILDLIYDLEQKATDDSNLSSSEEQTVLMFLAVLHNSIDFWRENDRMDDFHGNPRSWFSENWDDILTVAAADGMGVITAVNSGVTAWALLAGGPIGVGVATFVMSTGFSLVQALELEI